MIHSTAIIDPRAVVDSTVEVGPYAIIDAHVQVGPRCRVGPHAHLTGHTTIGADNLFHTGCVIGDAPQDLKYQNEPTRLRIGDGNVFREFVTVHRSAKMDGETVVGSHNLLMVNSHVAHNATLGNHVILANGALLGGHVQVEDRAFISGNCLVHQFVRIGTLAMMQGGSAISMDLPPFMMARGDNGICGLNTVGLRRAGYSKEERQDLKRLYHQLFRSQTNLAAATRVAVAQYAKGPCAQVLAFIAQSKRGVCRDYTRLHSGRDSQVETPE